MSTTENTKTEAIVKSENVKNDMIRLLQQPETEALSLVAKNGKHTVVIMSEKITPYEKAVKMMALLVEVFLGA